MTSSPLKKNYIHQIRNIKPFKPSQPQKKYKNEVKKVTQPKQQNTMEVYNDCIRSKICLEKYPDKYFELILFQSGIFNINLVQVSKILSQSERKNISKLCIPNQERLLKGLYLFPTQTMVLCQFDLQSRFHRQMIIYCPGEYLIVNNFTNGRIDKEQFNFNLKDLILVKTIYQNDRIMKVTDYFYGNDNRTYPINQDIHSKLKIKLQKYLKDKKLCQTIYELVDAKFDWLEPIQIKSGNTHYYGLLDTNQQLPTGLGLLINHKGHRRRTKSFSQLSTYEQSFDSGLEFYFGFFQTGLLNGIGQIWFQNKSTYYGQFDFGNAIGLGQFYSLQASNSIQQTNECFSYKDDTKSINQIDFFRWLKQSYFNGQKPFPTKRNKVFMHNQYQKLRKIYAIPKKKQIILPQQNFKRQSIDQNSQEIDDLMDQVSQVNLRIKDHSDHQNQDITFNKNDEIRDIFQKIKVKEQKAEKVQTASNKRLNIGKINIEKFQQNQRKNTSRSDDHTYNIFNNKKSQEFKENSKIKRTNTHLHQIQDQFRENQNLPHFQHQQMDQNQEIDLGYQEVDQSYFRNRQVNSSYKDMNDKDFIHKQYAFQEPKRFKTPDYFIVQYGKNHPKYDPTGARSNLFSQNLVKKKEFSSSSPLKKQKYLSPERKKTNQLGQKQNQHQLQKLQKTLTSGKNKRIFYNATKKN